MLNLQKNHEKHEKLGEEEGHKVVEGCLKVGFLGSCGVSWGGEKLKLNIFL